MILQGNRQDKPKLRNIGLGIFILTNVGVIFLAQSILMTEDREPIYNLDYIRSMDGEEETANPYDTVRVAYMDLVRSPIPSYLKNLQVIVTGVDPYQTGFFSYEITSGKLDSYLGSLTPPADSIVSPLAASRFLVQWDSCRQELALIDYLPEFTGSYFYVAGIYSDHYLEVDSSGTKIRHLAFRY
jgi:hypothetical protein